MLRLLERVHYRLLEKVLGTTDFCLGHARGISKLQAREEGYNRFIDSDDEEEGREEGLPDSRKKKNKNKKNKKTKKRKKHVSFDEDQK